MTNDTQQDDKIIRLESDVDEILRNHLPHILASIAQIKTDVGWLKRFFWVITTASIGSLIGAIINLAVK